MSKHARKAREIANNLFEAGDGISADRLALMKDGKELGGVWEKRLVELQIERGIADATADAVKLASWYGLLARAANRRLAEWGEDEGGWMQIGGLDWNNDPIRPVEISNGLPVERADIRAAIKQALSEPQEPRTIT